MNKAEKMSLLTEVSTPGSRAVLLPELPGDAAKIESLLPKELLAESLPTLPELTERELTRHYTRLESRLLSVDANFYPLGSCTMKYNPKLNEWAAGLGGFANLHPLQDADDVQGALALLYRLRKDLEEIAGLPEVCLTPAAGAHGEFSAVLVISQYFADHNDPRNEVLIPDSAHGTNPASCALCGKTVKVVKSLPNGHIDLDDLRAKVSKSTAAMMITNPSTLGLFEQNIRQIADILHQHGAQLYLDGANMNAILGRVRPGDFGVDVMHYNTHKTFSTPHGCGGPGAGPIAVAEHLRPYLPVPQVDLKDGKYVWDTNRPKSVGQVRSFHGQFLVLVRAYAYLRSLGAAGVADVSAGAVLAANYLARRLSEHYTVPCELPCMHEFVINAESFKTNGIHAIDIAKRLIDYGIHPPTMYFPMIVPECIMVEPTETEGVATLDRFVTVMNDIAQQAKADPSKLLNAPHTTPVGRVDEVQAARQPKLTWT